MYLWLLGATYGWYFNFGLNIHFYVRGAYEKYSVNKKNVPWVISFIMSKKIGTVLV